MGITHGTCTSQVRLDGKTAIVTGCNTGLGKCTVQDFYMRGCRVIMACRSIDKMNQAANEIKEECKDLLNLGEIVTIQLDLGSLKSVRTFAKTIIDTEHRIDLLVNNAGVGGCPQGKTEDGFETHFGTNHLGHFLLTLLLLPTIIKSAPARIINLSSRGNLDGKVDFNDLNYERRSYGRQAAYFQSKLANVMFSNELVEKLKAANVEGVNVYSVHPGVILTDLPRHMPFYLRPLLYIFYGYKMKTPMQGAQTTIYCSIDEKCANETGLYYAECQPAEPNKDAKNREMTQKLWDVSLKMVGLEADYDPFK